MCGRLALCFQGRRPADFRGRLTRALRARLGLGACAELGERKRSEQHQQDAARRAQTYRAQGDEHPSIVRMQASQVKRGTTAHPGDARVSRLNMGDQTVGVRAAYMAGMHAIRRRSPDAGHAFEVLVHQCLEARIARVLDREIAGPAHTFDQAAVTDGKARRRQQALSAQCRR